MHKIVRFFFFFLLASIPVFAYSQTLRAFVAAGDKAMDKSRFAEAIEYYKKALEFETDDPVLSFKMAEASRLYKDYERAAAWYGKIIIYERENVNPMALFRYAEMKKYLGMYEESCRVFERYINQFPLDTGYTGIKSRKEVADCPAVQEILARKNDIEIVNAGAPINTVYSEFGASMMGDTTLYFSSLRFKYENTRRKADSYYVSRILKSPPKPARNMQPLPMGISINEAASHNGNAAFSPDYKVMVYSRCPQPDAAYTLDCELFISRFTDGRWGPPVKISGDVNLSGYTSTQPSIAARGADGYTLYFASDRPGGLGKMDIWKSDFTPSFEFSPATNLGPVINTFDDEMTPFYNTPYHILYFSSYGHAGLGGMDIFRSFDNDGVFTEPENLGPGYNTSVDDVYYTINRDSTGGTFSSNRPGSMYIKSKTCCYDIYYYNIRIPREEVIVDSVPEPVAINPDKEDPGNKAYYDDFLPLELYFDNDEPDKRSMAVSTRKSYDKLYFDYINSVEEYRQNFSKNLSGEAKEEAVKKIDNFFENVVTKSWNQLNGFCAKVENALQKGVKIELEVRGRTSPLAETEYNIHLSRRRISSLENYMKNYNSGALKPWFADGSLKITEVAAGESLVKAGVSDQLTDKRNSVYNPDAAVERRIELINVNLVQPQ